MPCLSRPELTVTGDSGPAVQAITTQVALIGHVLLKKLAAPLGEPVPHIRDRVGVGPVFGERGIGDLRQCAESVGEDQRIEAMVGGGSELQQLLTRVPTAHERRVNIEEVARQCTAEFSELKAMAARVLADARYRPSNTSYSLRLCLGCNIANCERSSRHPGRS